MRICPFKECYKHLVLKDRYRPFDSLGGCRASDFFFHSRFFLSFCKIYYSLYSETNSFKNNTLKLEKVHESETLNWKTFSSILSF